MRSVAIKMLLGDRAKYLGLIFGVTFATLLMAQQVSIFIGLMARTASAIYAVRDADIWVMDTRVRYIEEVEPMRDSELGRVRSVPGVAWAVPFYKGLATIRMPDGLTQQVQLIGVDDVSLVGLCPEMVIGDPLAVQKPQTAMMDQNGYFFTWPGQPLQVGKQIELNDNRLTIGAVCDVMPTFFTFPIMYVSYNTVLEITPPTRNKLPFILVKAAPGEDVQQLKSRIAQQTRLQALTQEEFAFYIFVVENLKQFAAMKAIGVTNRQLFNMVMTQAAIVGATGYGMGIGLTALFFKATADAPALKGFMLHWQVVAGVAVMISLIIVFSILFSLRKVFRLDPAIVFRG